MRLMTLSAILFFCLLTLIGCDRRQAGTQQEATMVEARMQKYAVAPVTFDASSFDAKEKKLLATLIDVATLADQIYLEQTISDGNLRAQIAKQRHENDPLRQFFELQGGPYDRLDDDAPFMKVAEKSPAAGFYPPDLTRDEFETWLAENPDDRYALLSPYTLVRRSGDRLIAIPYSVAFRRYIIPMANKLRYAAKLTADEALQTYLLATADALLHDKYAELNSNWVGLRDSHIQFLVGPFGTDDDALLGIKASFEASLDLQDTAATARLDSLATLAPALDGALPYPNRYRHATAGNDDCYRVVDDIFAAGDRRVDFSRIAAYLPLDEKTCSARGSKKTIWKNSLAVRVREVLQPLAQQLIVEDQIEHLTRDGFFTYVALREMTVTLGPQHDSEDSTQAAAWLSQLKADVTAIFALGTLAQQQKISDSERRQALVSFLARLLQTIRIDNDEAPVLAAKIALDFLLDYGGVVIDEASGRFAIDFDRIEVATTLLANEVLLIQAEGDVQRAQALFTTYGQERPVVSTALARVAHLPLVEAPRYEVIWN